MPETPGIYIHPIHAVFPFADLTRPNITVTRFLELFDTVDPIDRDALIGLTAFALGVRAEDVDDEELQQNVRYSGFKKACDKLVAMDHVVLRGVVQEIMNIHHRWSDPTSTDEAVKSLHGFVEFSRSRGATEEELEKWRIMAEEKQVTKKSDLQVARRRYDLFCDTVVRPLLGY